MSRAMRIKEVKNEAKPILTAIISKQIIQMNIYKRQSIQKLIIDQAGSEKLILNDLILGRDGAQTLAQLLPQYHSNILHLQIKGNNIDSEGFQMIFMALMNCPNLITIQAEWNNIGSSPTGLMALIYIVQNLRFIELIDLKNNKISHQSADLICEIIKANNRSLKVLDLRWNDLGEVGAQKIYPAIAFNSTLKYIGLEDNRISSNTLLQITQYLKNTARGMLNVPIGSANQTLSNNTFTNYLPITDDAYPSMEIQLKTGQLRTKIESEQQQTMLQQQKMELQIQKAIQKIRVKGSQINQAQAKYDMLHNQNVNLINNLRESERVLCIVKEKFLGTDVSLNKDKSSLRAEKCKVNSKIQILMQKTIQRQQRQLEDLTNVMAQKYQRLNAYLKDKLNEKRSNREKLVQIKEDTLTFKLNKQTIWDKVTLSVATSKKNSWEDQCYAVQDMIAKAQASLKSQRKKGDYLTEQLTNFVMRGLKREEKFQKEIFDIQNKIKDLHKQMTLANVDIEQNQCKLFLKDAEIIQKDAVVDLNRRYVKYIQSQNTVNMDIERLKIDEDSKVDRLTDQTLQMRIGDLERAIRQQQAQNKMIKNHYQKILAQLQAITKNTIQAVMFQGIGNVFNVRLYEG